MKHAGRERSTQHAGHPGRRPRRRQEDPDQLVSGPGRKPDCERGLGVKDLGRRVPIPRGRCRRGLGAQQVAPVGRPGEIGQVAGRVFLQPIRRIRGGVVESVAVELGLRDESRELIEITKGVTPGDTLLVGGAVGLAIGTRVVVTKE